MRITLKSFVRFVRAIQAVVVIVLLFVAYSLILPEEARLEREIEIETGPELIFNHFNDSRLYTRWSPWFAESSAVELVLDGPVRGVGATLLWRDSQDASDGGSREVITSVPYKIVSSRMEFGDNIGGISSVTIYNNSENTRCRVVWTYDARLEGVIQRYQGRFLDGALGAKLEAGLIRLKRLAEVGAEYADSPDA